MASYQIQQSTTGWALAFFLTDSSDHIAGKTGASPTVTISKNGGAFGSPAGAVTEVANGWYKVAGNATDTGTLGPLILHATASGADPCDVLYEVVAVNPQSTAFGLSLAKTTNITGFNDIAATDIVTSGAITTSSGKVSGVVLVDTLTTYTGNTVQTGDSFARIGAAGAGLTDLASAANLATVDTVVDAIKVKTDSLTFTGDDVHAFVHQMVANVITAGTFATDAFGADEFSAAAVTKIQAGLSTLTTSQVNAEMVDVLATDTYAEPGQGAPAATTTLAAKLNYLYKLMRNKITQTSTTLSVFADDGTTVDHKATTSDDATTYTRGEIVSGP
jgi:hypothetical protein